MSFFKKRTTGYIFSIVSVVIIAGMVAGVRFYRKIYGPNMDIANGESSFLYIPTNTGYDEVCALLFDAGLGNEESFRWVAGKMNYPNKVRAGRYRLFDGMSNIELIRMLRSGRQIPVQMIFNNIRTAPQLAGTVAQYIEADSASILHLLEDSSFLLRYRLMPRTALTLFIPNTYEFFWNTSATAFMERMNREYNSFWNDDRKRKAKEMNMSSAEVSVLASIIEEETRMDSEKPVMAGVYINRLHQGIPLQADPTLKYAAGDFTIKRVLNKHREIQSPYNTYLHKGLPPGPICIPSIASLDAVLNYTKHDYLYFCAKDDLSGYHLFARTLQQHNRNAQAYQKALDKLRVYR
jgi:UPF0755 protein